jgi:serine/threonine protein kinase, bacterial
MASRSMSDTVPDLSFVLEAGAVPIPGYKLIRLRGRGGYAEVWEASDPDRKRVALKFMSTQQTVATARELRALQSLYALDHPNLLKCSNVWCIPGFVVIGMELADASLLDLFLLYADDLHEAMGVGVILKHLYQAAQALDFLNARRHLFDGRTVGFQHGDIKPNNILIIGETAKIADYGLATPTNGPSTPCHRHGTYDYLAPEVFRGTMSDASDQYSLAVTFIVLRTGAFPFPVVPKKLPGSFVRESPNLATLCPAEQPILSRALAPIPQNRFPTCADFIRALAQANSVGGLSGISPPNSTGGSLSKLLTAAAPGSMLPCVTVAAQGLSRLVPPRP